MTQPKTHAPLEDQHARTPIDRVAARVTRRGEHHQFPMWSEEVCIRTPLPLRERLPPDMPNYTGVRFGLLTVIGLTTTVNTGNLWKRDPLNKGENKGGARWLCRCSCGMFTLRKSKAIRIHDARATEQGFDDACLQCRTVEQARRGSLPTKGQRRGKP